MTTSSNASIFSNAPNDGDEGMRYQILRTGPKGLTGPIVTSHDPLGLYTHWMGGRTVPCIQSNCDHCNAKIPTKRHQSGLQTHVVNDIEVPCTNQPCEPCEQNAARRWYGFLMVHSFKQDRSYLFEYTASAAAAVVSYWETHRTLRGAKISAARQGNRPNGRLELFLTPPAAEADRLPKAPNRVDLLAQMWSVPLEAFLNEPKRQADEPLAAPTHVTKPKLSAPLAE